MNKRGRRQRRARTGSIAANPHEGSRSEYLAQYVFASFGTAVAVQHQEDSGIDLFCTITERVGQLAWPRAHFTVQVKSVDSAWKFESDESVRWLLDHPLPLFLCVVDKKEARLRVFQTLPRLVLPLFPPLPSEVALQPGRTTKGTVGDWTSSAVHSLGAPIVDYTITDLLDDASQENARSCLRAWADIDADNIRRRTNGVAEMCFPRSYVTNEVPGSRSGRGRRRGAGTSTLTGVRTPDAIPRLIEMLEHVGRTMVSDFHRSTGDGGLTPLAIINMLHRLLTMNPLEDIAFLNDILNDRMGLANQKYVFAAVDALIDEVRKTVDGPPAPKR